MYSHESKYLLLRQFITHYADLPACPVSLGWINGSLPHPRRLSHHTCAFTYGPALFNLARDEWCSLRAPAELPEKNLAKITCPIYPVRGAPETGENKASTFSRLYAAPRLPGLGGPTSISVVTVLCTRPITNLTRSPLHAR